MLSFSKVLSSVRRLNEDSPGLRWDDEVIGDYATDVVNEIRRRTGATTDSEPYRLNLVQGQQVYDVTPTGDAGNSSVTFEGRIVKVRLLPECSSTALELSQVPMHDIPAGAIVDQEVVAGGTSYIGGTDAFKYTTPDVTFSGFQTYCFEVFVEKSQTVTGTCFNFGNSLSGFTLDWDTSVNGLIGQIHSGSGDGVFTPAPDTNSGRGVWTKVVFTFGADRDGSELYLNAEPQEKSGINATFTEPTTSLLYARDHATGSNCDCRLRNVEVYSGIPENPTEWLPGDVESLIGVTLVTQDPLGNGESPEGVLFGYATGNPITDAVPACTTSRVQDQGEPTQFALGVNGGVEGTDQILKLHPSPSRSASSAIIVDIAEDWIFAVDSTATSEQNNTIMPVMQRFEQPLIWMIAGKCLIEMNDSSFVEKGNFWLQRAEKMIGDISAVNTLSNWNNSQNRVFP